MTQQLEMTRRSNNADVATILRERLNTALAQKAQVSTEVEILKGLLAEVEAKEQTPVPANVPVQQKQLREPVLRAIATNPMTFAQLKTEMASHFPYRWQNTEEQADRLSYLLTNLTNVNRLLSITKGNGRAVYSITMKGLRELNKLDDARFAGSPF